MAIYEGTKKVLKLYEGTKQVLKRYIGSVLAYTSGLNYDYWTYTAYACYGMYVMPDGKTVYIGDGTYIKAVDAESGTQVHSDYIGKGETLQVVVDAAEEYLYGITDSGWIFKSDLSNTTATVWQTDLGDPATNLILSADESKLYVANSYSILEVGTSDGTASSFDADNVIALKLSNDGLHIWCVVRTTSSTVRKKRISDGVDVFESDTIGTTSAFLDIDEDETIAIIGGRSDGEFYIVDLSTGVDTEIYDSTGVGCGAQINKDGTYAYIAYESGGHAYLQKMQLSDQSIIWTYSVSTAGDAFRDIQLSPDEKVIYLAYDDGAIEKVYQLNEATGLQS